MPWQDAVQEITGGIRLLLDVRPGTRVSIFPAGFHAWRGRIQAKTRAPAQDGHANAELVAAVAAFFDRPVQDVTVTDGTRQRRKAVAVRGVAHAWAVERLEAAFSSGVKQES